jgi:hypothetical protein
MSTAIWEIRGREFVNCNCAYGCPCQFNALPTHGNCIGIGAVAIERGHHNGVRLDGLNAAWLLSWPNPIHEGNGTAQAIVDARADPAQRDALVRIVSGEDTEPGATHWQVFASTMTAVLEPKFLPIDFSIDVAAREARLAIPGLATVVGEPIRNPVTGDVHRARIDLPFGFEYLVAEMGSGSAKVTGDVPMELKDSYGQFAEVHLSHAGIVMPQAA